MSASWGESAFFSRARRCRTFRDRDRRPRRFGFLGFRPRACVLAGENRASFDTVRGRPTLVPSPASTTKPAIRNESGNSRSIRDLRAGTKQANRPPHQQLDERLVRRTLRSALPAEPPRDLPRPVEPLHECRFRRPRPQQRRRHEPPHGPATIAAQRDPLSLDPGQQPVDRRRQLLNVTPRCNQTVPVSMRHSRVLSGESQTIPSL